MNESENSANNIAIVAIEFQCTEVNNTPENQNRGCKETGVPRKKKLRPETWKRNIAKKKR